MTTFLGGGGTGGSGGSTREMAALRDIDSRTKSFVNRDFVQNIAWLNQSVDTLSQYTQKLQAGVESANKNFLEEIQGFWGDLFTLFAGLEPTGIDVGDVKYILQGIGAFFGINPDTPFPLNLIDAAWHFFSTYIVPVEQFTDLIFDTLILWAEDLGLSESFIDSLRELQEAIENVSSSFGEFFESIADLLSALGFISLNDLGDLLAAVLDLFDLLALEPLKPVFHLLSELGVPFINALTDLIEFGTSFLVPIGWLTDAAPNMLKAGSFGPDSFEPGFGWTWDGSVGRTNAGSARAEANGQIREIMSDPMNVAVNQEIELSVWIRWASVVYTGNNHVRLSLRLYDGNDLINVVDIDTQTFTTGTQATWQKLDGEYVIPNGINKVRTSLRVMNNVTSGFVWFDDADTSKHGLIQLPWVAGLVSIVENVVRMFGLGFLEDLLGTLNPFEIWANIINTILNPLSLIRDFLAQDLIQEIVDGFGNILEGIPFVGGFLADLWDTLTDFFDDVLDIGAQASDAKLGLDATREIIVSSISQTEPPEEINDEIVEDVLTTQTQVIIQQGAAIEALQNQFVSDTNQGRSILDDFEYVEEDDLENTGNWERFVLDGTDPKINTADGHNAGIDSNGTVFYRNNVETLTNFQRVSIVPAGAIGYAFFDARRPHMACYTRVSADGQKWVRAFWNNAQQVVIDYKNGASSGTLWNSGADSQPLPGAGQNLTLEAGVGAEAGSYRVLRGTTPIHVINDTGHLTDWDQKGWGFGLRRDNGWGPPALTQTNAADNTPPPIPGIALRVTRFSGSVSIPATSGTMTKLPNNTFNSTVYITDKIDYDPASNCKITFHKTGRYAITLRLHGPGLATSVNRFAICLFKGDDVIELGSEQNSNDVDTNVGQRYRETFIVYAVAGDEFYPGFLTGTNSTSLTGEVNGILNYMAVMEI